jgi:hypothetical protein
LTFLWPGGTIPEAPIFVSTFDLLAPLHTTHADLFGLSSRVHKPGRGSIIAFLEG